MRLSTLQPSAKESEFVSLPQASREHPEVSTAFFRKLVWQRKLPFYKFGSRVMFKRAELEAYFESRRIPARTESA
jgi:excisionase family DNA binding protein